MQIPNSGWSAGVVFGSAIIGGGLSMGFSNLKNRSPMRTTEKDGTVRRMRK